MEEFSLKLLSPRYEIYPFRIYTLVEHDLIFELKIKESKKNMADNLNIRIGEKYPITVQVEPVNTDYKDFLINDDSFIKIYNSTGGLILTENNLIIDNELKTVTFLWDTKPQGSSIIDMSPQQYTLIMWVSISYTAGNGETINTLLASDNITKNLIRSSRIE